MYVSVCVCARECELWINLCSTCVKLPQCSLRSSHTQIHLNNLCSLCWFARRFLLILLLLLLALEWYFAYPIHKLRIVFSIVGNFLIASKQLLHHAHTHTHYGRDGAKLGPTQCNKSSSFFSWATASAIASVSHRRIAFVQNVRASFSHI